MKKQTIMSEIMESTQNAVHMFTFLYLFCIVIDKFLIASNNNFYRKCFVNQ